MALGPQIELHPQVVVLFPAHEAHLKSMKELVSRSLLLSGRQCVAVLRTPRTQRSSVEEISPGFFRMEWPSTRHGTSLDGGAIIEARKIAYFLLRRFGGISHVISGDFQGEHALTARLVANIAGSASVLIPEGVGVFRKLTHDYPWVIREWRSSVGLLITDSARELADMTMAKFGKIRKRRWSRRLRPLWRLYRIFSLATHRPSTTDLRKEVEFEMALSSWPHDIIRLLGIDNSEFVTPEWANIQPNTKNPGKTEASYDLFFIHQSLQLSRPDWARIIGKLQHLNVSTVLVKLDRHDLDKDSFLGALREVFPNASVVVYSGGQTAEEVAVATSTANVVSVTSTALFNLAFLPSARFKLISLVRTYWSILYPSLELPENQEMGYGFLPLFLTGRGGQIKFL